VRFGPARVSAKYPTNWQTYAAFTQGKSSWYGLNIDGKTDADDLAIIQANMGLRCPK
jgi:hypothetical protein